jgi:outer membrane protein insertion porin family
MHKIFPAIIFVFLSLNLSYPQVQGQKYEVGKLSFEGNNALKDDQLINVINTRETPWVLWKWIYNRFDKEILGGQKPEYYDAIKFASDYLQLKRFYKDNGFIHSEIDTSIIVNQEDGKVYLNFLIIEGRRSLIDTIKYKGFEGLPPDLLEELSVNPQISIGAPYIQSKVEDEHRRLIGIMVNNGYINMKVIAVNAQHYSSTDNFSVVFIFNPGKRYTFGRISVDQDTLSVQRIDTAIVLRHLDFTTGEYYGELKKIESERNLNRLGIFEASKIENAIPDISSEITNIPMRVQVRTRSFQELTPEIGVNDENNAFNLLFGIGYNHRNLFGGARNFSTRLRFNLQSFQFRTIFKGNALKDSGFVSKAELTIQLIQPYFFNNKTSISFALTAMIDKQASYYIPSLSSRIGTQSQTATYTRLFVDWNLQLSDPKTVGVQQDSAFTELIKDLGFEKQFNSFITLTLQRDKRNDIFYPSEGVFQSISFEEGGLIPQIFNVNLPYSQYIKLTLDGQWYIDPSNKRNVIWAARLRSGAALLFESSPLGDIPLTQRFYSGGSGSVRGWRARDLGMVIEKTQGGDAFFEGNVEARWNLLKDAGNLWFLDLTKLSLVFFWDCGNVWTKPKYMRVSEVAMAFGLGIRYNTIAGPIRIDFGMKMYDPEAPESIRWVMQKRFFPETAANGVIHLGVGHTF